MIIVIEIGDDVIVTGKHDLEGLVGTVTDIIEAQSVAKIHTTDGHAWIYIDNLEPHDLWTTWEELLEDNETYFELSEIFD